jgi:hypothetical protein
MKPYTDRFAELGVDRAGPGSKCTKNVSRDTGPAALLNTSKRVAPFSLVRLRRMFITAQLNQSAV